MRTTRNAKPAEEKMDTTIEGSVEDSENEMIEKAIQDGTFALVDEIISQAYDNDENSPEVINVAPVKAKGSKRKPLEQEVVEGQMHKKRKSSDKVQPSTFDSLQAENTSAPVVVTEATVSKKVSKSKKQAKKPMESAQVPKDPLAVVQEDTEPPKKVAKKERKPKVSKPKAPKDVAKKNTRTSPRTTPKPKEAKKPAAPKAPKPATSDTKKPKTSRKDGIPTKVMVMEAIETNYDARKGVSFTVVKTYIKRQYKLDNLRYIKNAVHKLLSTGKLIGYTGIGCNGSFKLPKEHADKLRSKKRRDSKKMEKQANGAKETKAKVKKSTKIAPEVKKTAAKMIGIVGPSC